MNFIRKSLLFSLALIGSQSLVVAQNCAPNGITTDPFAPINVQNPVKINTFNYMGDKFALNNYYLTNATTINSPFYDTDNPTISHFYDPIDGIKDILAQDGWELIKRDFGYNDDGSKNTSTTSNPYMVMYNRYTGKLRVFVARGMDQAGYGGANIVVRFSSDSPMETSLLELYSGSGTLKAMDETFVKGNIGATVATFDNRPLKWFYADFATVYDPCTCLFQSKMEIRVTLTNKSTITLTGTSTGSIVSNGKPNSVEEGKKSLSVPQLTSLGKKGIDGFKKLNDFANSNPQGKLGGLANALKSSSFLKAGMSTIPYLNAAIGLLDFFTGGGKKASGPQQVEIMPMSINMQHSFSGEISENEHLYGGITFRTPGSKYVTTMPNSEYPYYNEVLGLVNILKKPTFQMSSRTWTEGATKDQMIRITERSYRIAQDLDYVLNPAANMEVQEVKAALIYTNSDSDIELIDLACLRQHIFTAEVVSGESYKFLTAPKIKLVFNLKRKNATDNTQNVLVTYTYLVNVQGMTNLGTTTACAGGVKQPLDAASVQNFCATTYATSRGLTVGGRYEQMVQEMEQNEAKEAQHRMPIAFALYPNPSTSETTIQYNLVKEGNIKIELIDITGQKIQTLIESTNHEAGDFETKMDVSKLKAGIYIVAVEANGYRTTQKLVITH